MELMHNYIKNLKEQIWFCSFLGHLDAKSEMSTQVTQCDKANNP